MTNPYRDMCAELAQEVEQLWSIVRDDNNEPNAVASRARALLDQQEAQPPAAGEVAELVEWLRAGAPLSFNESWRPRLTRAADLLQRQAEWKASALAVERKWDANGIATMLGCQLGESQRACIQREVPRLLDRLRELEHPQPVPVSERLPKAGEWVWHCYAGVRFWQHGIYNGRQFFIGDGPRSQPATHWRPADALPLPTAEATNA